MNQISVAPKTAMQRFLDVVERVGNKVPHPAVIFLILIVIVVVLSHILYLMGTSVTAQVIEPGAQAVEGETPDINIDYAYPYSQELFKTHHVEEETISVKSLLTTAGIRFMYSSLIPSFMSFTAVGLIIVAMLGVGVAEESGLVNSLIRKLVTVSPRWALCYILVFVGILSSIAADAGYLVLIPLAGTAFLSVGRHPLAGLATGFAAVAGAFTVNMLIKPLDAILTEFTNDAIHLVDPVGLDRSDGQLVVFHRVGPVSDSPRDADHGESCRASPGRVPRRATGRRRRRTFGRRIARLEVRIVRSNRGAGRVWSADDPGRSAVAKSRHGSAHRRLAVHERPDRRHHGFVPGDGSCLRRRRQNDEEPDGHHQGDGKSAIEPGQPPLAAVRHQPIRGLLQLQQHRNHHGDEDGRSAQNGEYRPVVAADWLYRGGRPSSTCSSPERLPNGPSSRPSLCRC